MTPDTAPARATSAGRGGTRSRRAPSRHDPDISAGPRRVRQLHAATLGGTAAVVRGRRDVLDRADLEAGGLERPDRRLAARARALDEDVDLAHAVLLRAAGSGLGGHLGGERGRL